MATPNYTGTDEELQKALTAVQHAYELCAPLLTDNFRVIFEKLVHSMELRVYRRQRDYIKDKMRRPLGRPRTRPTKSTNE